MYLNKLAICENIILYMYIGLRILISYNTYNYYSIIIIHSRISTSLTIIALVFTYIDGWINIYVVM